MKDRLRVDILGIGHIRHPVTALKAIAEACDVRFDAGFTVLGGCFDGRTLVDGYMLVITVNTLQDFMRFRDAITEAYPRTRVTVLELRPMI